MRGGFISSQLYRGADKVFSLKHPNFPDLGRICFLVRTLEYCIGCMIEQPFRQKKKKSTKDGKQYKAFNKDDIIPRHRLTGSSELMESLAIRNALEPIPRKKSQQVAQRQPEGSTSARASRKSTQLASTRRAQTIAPAREVVN